MKYREFCNKLDFTLIRTRGTKRRDLKDFFPAPVVFFRETILLFLISFAGTFISFWLANNDVITSRRFNRALDILFLVFVLIFVFLMFAIVISLTNYKIPKKVNLWRIEVDDIWFDEEILSGFENEEVVKEKLYERYLVESGKEI